MKITNRGIDDDDNSILEMIKGRIDRVWNHKLDEKRILCEITDIIEQIEDIAMRAEMGEFELPSQESND